MKPKSRKRGAREPTGKKPLTEKQKKFADYLLLLDNETEAAKRAGYSPRSAGSIGNENMNKPEIREYIEKRRKEAASKRIASIQEVMEFQTAVMRGEEKDQSGLDAPLGIRLDASKELMKRLAAAEDKKSGESKVQVIIDV